MTSSPAAARVNATSRREQNKIATRDAIASAALELLRSEGFEGLTADRVAEAAGVSRRTFFNYFHSVESALNVPTELFLQQALQRIDDQGEGLSIISAGVEAMRGLADLEHLAPVAELFALAAEGTQLNRLQLEAWQDCADQLLAAIGERFPSADPLGSTVFAHTIMAAGKAAFTHWQRTHGRDLSEASLRSLQGYLAEALALVGDGFTQLTGQRPSAPAHGQES
ncbi:TetR/AcrR family transcriptional regulator [Zafaria sp. Z1313]|uniref:TetR/AcrR family transcriptional regulator n=1 Tax=Zafaria sp. Z1313 TaxID=3423202 RepID=UPI003D30245C